MIAKLNRLSVLFGPDGTKFTFTVDVDDEPAVREFLNDYRSGVEYSIQIKPKKRQRSVSANALFWTLIGKIANALAPATKEDVYRRIIQNAGVYTCITLEEKAYSSFQQAWESKGLGWFIEPMSPVKDGMVDVACYYGSSSYNTEEMARCIDFALEEAKELGIDTLPRKEIERIKKKLEKPNAETGIPAK